MEATSKPKFVYVTYIATTLEKLWDALTKADFTEKYWFGSRIESDWKVGSPFTIHTGVPDKDWKGKVLQCDPPGCSPTPSGCREERSISPVSRSCSNTRGRW